ncbi:baseplate J/gp47 family protein [Selenomonas sp. AE3005]|uniref:baseplate assembly protein n=1 Tax=Selenomonas sp. AE3005 TaxID=1485543 RepID=UPI0025E30B24|nr:baseplate J/gp47 family protein [Selenomonas sp. AE3005]
MKLADLPDIDFVNVNVDDLEAAMFEAYTNITGRTLSKADPIRLFILFIADVMIQIKNGTNDTGKMNLLKYATGDYLDNLAALLGVTRIPAKAATTTLEVELSAAREMETIIPAGTRVSAGGDLYFATDETLTITAGNTKESVGATCVVTGVAGNDFQPGEISTIVDPIAFVAGMTNITKSEGGSELEKDDALRQRVFEAPESFSCAGPAGAYEFFAKSLNSSIVDVSVDSPKPGVVQVTPLLTGGGIPEDEFLSEIQGALSADNVRPLTDHVIVTAPEVIEYDIVATYYVDSSMDAAAVQQNINTAVANFIAWEYSKLGRDVVPSKLIQYMMGVNGVKRVDVTSPVYTASSKNQIAKVGTVTVTMGGSEDE